MRVPLARALSKLGAASRAEAARLVLAGRVEVDGIVVRDPAARVVLESAAILVDGVAARRPAWSTLLLNKPRGVVTTSRDPEGRPTIFSLLGGVRDRLVTVGRLDLATSGLLLLTTDTRLAAWLTDPVNRVARLYTATVRGEVTDEECVRLQDGVADAGELLRADEAKVRKRSRRETHLVVRLREGRSREIRRLFEALGHEVSRLRRVAFGGLELGALPDGAWRTVTVAEMRAAFPGAPLPEPDLNHPGHKGHQDAVSRPEASPSSPTWRPSSSAPGAARRRTASG